MSPVNPDSDQLSQPVVSIIIVNWNTRDLLTNCLRSIVAETLCGYEIIVIDNASSDGSAQMIRGEFPHVHLFENNENRGFAAANNQGIQLATGRYVLLLNPDTLILDGAIDRTLAYADATPDAGVIGCRVLEAADKVQQTCFGFPHPSNLFLLHSGLNRLFPKSRLFGRAKMGWWDRQSERDVDVVSGMFMLVRRSALDQIGNMDESFFVYAEEADWCLRFQKRGWRCVFTPVASILHLDGGGKGASQARIEAHIQKQKSLLRFNRKHYGRCGWLMTKSIMMGAAMVRYLLFSPIARLKPKDTSIIEKALIARRSLSFHFVGREPVIQLSTPSVEQQRQYQFQSQDVEMSHFTSQRTEGL